MFDSKLYYISIIIILTIKVGTKTFFFLVLHLKINNLEALLLGLTNN